MVPLNVGKVGIWFQVFHGDLISIMEGMGIGNEDVGGCRKELMEDEVVGLEELFQDGTVEVVHIEDADFTFHIRHITDDFIGLCFLKTKIVGVAAVFLDEVDKGIDRKGVVLGRNTKFLLAAGLGLIVGFKECGLFQDLTGIA